MVEISWCILGLLLAAALQEGSPKEGERLFPKDSESMRLDSLSGEDYIEVDAFADIRFDRREGNILIVRYAGFLLKVNSDEVIALHEVAKYCEKKLSQQTATPHIWHTLLACEANERNDHQSSLREARKAVAIKPTAVNEMLLAMLLMKSERYEDALSQLNTFESKYGDNYMVRGNRASALTELGRFSEAIAELDHSIEATSVPAQKIECVNLQAKIKMKTGDFTGAKKDLEESLRLVPKNPKALNRIAWLLATCREKEIRDPALALSYAQELMKISDSSNPYHHDTFAAVLAANGAFTKAKEQMRQAIEILHKDDSSLAEFKERLSLYEQNEAFIDK